MLGMLLGVVATLLHVLFRLGDFGSDFVREAEVPSYEPDPDEVLQKLN